MPGGGREILALPLAIEFERNLPPDVDPVA